MKTPGIFVNLAFQKEGQRAFTLNELLVTVALLGILSVVVVPLASDALLKARIAQTQNNLRVVANGIEAFAADRGFYPFGSKEPPTRFLTNYDALKALKPLLGTYLSSNPDLLCDPFTKRTADALNESIALGNMKIPDLFGYGYFDYNHFMVPPQTAKQAYGLISFGPDQKDSGLGLRPLPGIGNLLEGAMYQPSNGLQSDGDMGRFGGSLAFPQHIP